MFNRFLDHFVADHGPEQGCGDLGFQPDDLIVAEFFARFSGTSFNNGLYRVFRSCDVQDWNSAVEAAFPVFKGKLTCFGVDWLGRIFALDSGRQVNRHSGVTIFEPGSGQALMVPRDIEMFHEIELIDSADAALAESFFNQWVQAGGSRPLSSQCVGYKRPLFLGGTDTLENLELTDLDVYWTISAQLISKLRGVSPGTSVKIKAG
jgi:hypothetical protein